MKRSGPLRRGKGLERRTRLKPMSAKRGEIAPSRRELVKRYLDEHPVCEAYIPDVCRFEACDLHEIRTRARGGSILDEANIVALCRPCHDAITRDPKWAEENGYMVHSWSTELDLEAAALARQAWKRWALKAWEMDPEEEA